MHTQESTKLTLPARDKTADKAAEMGLSMTAYTFGGDADHYDGWSLLTPAEQKRRRAIITASFKVCTS